MNRQSRDAAKAEKARVKSVMKAKNERTARELVESRNRAVKENHEDNEEWVQIHKSGK